MSDIKVNIKVEVRESIIEACERIRREAEALNPAIDAINAEVIDIEYTEVKENDQKLLQQ